VTIAEFSDPPFRGDVARTVFPAYFLYLKRWARQFDYFTIPVEKTLPCYTPYIDRDRVRIIPQGFDLSTVRRLPYTPHAKPVFAYAGRFYETRSSFSTFSRRSIRISGSTCMSTISIPASAK